MRISDWSSDVCSSDLDDLRHVRREILDLANLVASVSRADLLDLTERRVAIEEQCLQRSIENGSLAWEGRVLASLHELSRTPVRLENEFNPEIGRASCRERVCQ